jgi:hypothetical protein
MARANAAKGPSALRGGCLSIPTRDTRLASTGSRAAASSIADASAILVISSTTPIVATGPAHARLLELISRASW